MGDQALPFAQPGLNARKDALAQKSGRAYADLVAAGKDVALWPDHLRQQMYLGR
jgi:hypothetical protein